MSSRSLTSFLTIALIFSSNLTAFAQTANCAQTPSQEEQAQTSFNDSAATDLVRQLFQKVDEGAYEQALVLADQVVAEEPNQPTGYELRSTIYYAMGFYQKAIDDATKATSLGSKKPSVVKLSKMSKDAASKKAKSHDRVAAR